MNPEDLKQVWQAQSSPSRMTIDAELLLKEVQRNQRSLAAAIFWRDVREVGVSLLLAPVWVYLGVKQSAPWTWYLTVPALLWIAGFMLAGRIRQKRARRESGASLRRHVESSLAQVEHQIWLLRNVFWWYLLPLALAMLAFFGHAAWRERAGGWWTLLAVSMVVAIGAIIFGGIYWLNQRVVRSELEPRRQELESLLVSLSEETPGR
jgi:hypothetical protein